MREAKLEIGVHCRGCQRYSCTPPHTTACPLHVQLPAPLTANRHRKKIPMHANLWLAVILPVIQPKAKAAGSSSALGKLQYLRQDKPELCYSGSGRSGSTHGKQPCYFWWAAAASEGGQFHPVQHGSPVLAEPVPRASLFHGSGTNPRLLLSFTLPMQRKMAFWRLRAGMETILGFLKSLVGLNDLVSLQSSRVSLLLLCSSEACTFQAPVTFYQNLGVMSSCLPAMYHTQQHCAPYHDGRI